MRSLRALVAAVLVAAGTGTAAGAAAAPVLTGRTTITSHGDGAIRLRVPSETMLTTGDVDLFTRGATYAFVRLLGPPRTDCPAYVGAHCDQKGVSWVRGFHDTRAYATRAPGRRHQATLGIPPRVLTPYLDVYVFTDGDVTLTLYSELPGRGAYRTGRAPRHRVALLAPTCVPLGCASDAGRTNGVSYGGETFDLQGDGWAEYFAVNRNDDMDAGNQHHDVAGCLFPDGSFTAESPEARDHPLGCLATSRWDYAAWSAVNIAGAYGIGAGPTTGVSWNRLWTGAHGRQYIGFQATGAGPAPSRTTAYAIWFTYL